MVRGRSLYGLVCGRSTGAPKAIGTPLRLKKSNSMSSTFMLHVVADAVEEFVEFPVEFVVGDVAAMRRDDIDHLTTGGRVQHPLSALGDVPRCDQPQLGDQGDRPTRVVIECSRGLHEFDEHRNPVGVRGDVRSQLAGQPRELLVIVGLSQLGGDGPELVVHPLQAGLSHRLFGDRRDETDCRVAQLGVALIGLR